ncbi:MAG: ParB/RepB/Spo0J family partition protein [Thermodesulfobacteriota bacterium]
MKEAGLETIPAILVEGNHDEIALVENILREDLTAIEFAEALDRIQIEHNYTQEQLTSIIGKSKSTVSEILSLNRLPKEIRDECRNDPSVSRQVLLNIARKKREKEMRTQYNKYKAKKQAIRKPRGKSTFQTRFTSKFDKMKTFMTDIDLGKLDVAERKDLSSLVEELKKPLMVS